MSQDHLRVEQDGRVTLVTLNRPHRLNALSHDLLADLRRVLRSRFLAGR